MRVILAEDSVLFRKGLVRLLQDGGLEVVAEVGEAGALLDRVAVDPPDVAIVDIRMPPTHTTEGIEAAVALRNRFPDVGVLVLSHHVEVEYAVELLESSAGGVGYLLKDRVTDPVEVLEAVARIASGGTVVDPEVITRLLSRSRHNSPLDRLSDREGEVLAAMAKGHSNQAIADALFMSPKTVETHIRSIFQKLGLPADPDNHRRVLAVVTWLRSTS
jgi:DNA-binding NarL/FixJ family response regulator